MYTKEKIRTRPKLIMHLSTDLLFSIILQLSEFRNCKELPVHDALSAEFNVIRIFTLPIN